MAETPSAFHARAARPCWSVGARAEPIGGDIILISSEVGASGGEGGGGEAEEEECWEEVGDGLHCSCCILWHCGSVGGYMRSAGTAGQVRLARRGAVICCSVFSVRNTHTELCFVAFFHSFFNALYYYLLHHYSLASMYAMYARLLILAPGL